MKAFISKLVTFFACFVVLSFYSVDVSSKPLKDIKSLGENEIILVGRVELRPALEEFEQHLKGIGSKRFKNTATFLIGERIVDMDNFRFRDRKLAEGVKLDKDFFVHRKRNDTLFYSGSMIYTSIGRGGMENIILPGGLKYSIRASDRAIYIGTIRYHRDDYNAITKVKLVDDFKKANATFIKRFGKSVKLRQVRPKLVK